MSNLFRSICQLGISVGILFESMCKRVITVAILLSMCKPLISVGNICTITLKRVSKFYLVASVSE